ncbi:hypothetical protein Lepto7375DRAFT_1069 [Leptolyngbya sp. PCC 7375]|nr:hypothetical protein Lepto7375DRAFT_1069 [Leptolyngbya sp. PCC 7375]
MDTDLQGQLRRFYQNAAVNTPLSADLEGLKESIHSLLQKFMGLWELVPIGSRITQTHVDGSSSYDYIALIPSYREDKARPPLELIQHCAQYFTSGLKSSFGVTVKAPTFQFWYRGEPDRVLSVHPALYLVNHNEWSPGNPAPSAMERTWHYPSSERRWSTFDHAARGAWIDQLDNRTDGQLRRIIRLLKAWKYQSEFTVQRFIPQPGAWDIHRVESFEGLPIYSYFLECAACEWLQQHPDEGRTWREDLAIVHQILSVLARRVRQACESHQNVFIQDPSEAVKPGILSASAYDEQSMVANHLEESAEKLGELIPLLNSSAAEVAVMEMFGLLPPVTAEPSVIAEPPIQPDDGDPCLQGTPVTAWIWQLDDQLRVPDTSDPTQADLIARVRSELSHHRGRYWYEAGSTHNGTGVRGYSDRDFLAGLPIVTRKNPPSSMLLRFEALLKPLLEEAIEGYFDAPAFVLWPAGRRELAIDIVPVARISEIERRWTEPYIQFGQPEISAFQGLGGTILEPWPDHPKDLVFCMNAQTFYPIDPEQHLDWLGKADNSTDGYARILIRLLKLWKYQRSVPICSYYLEMFVVRWLMMGHHVDGHNIYEVVAKCPKSEADLEKLPRFIACGNPSKDLSHIVVDLHEHLREPLSRGEMPGIQDMSTEDWWARAMPCRDVEEVRTILRELRKGYGLTAQACKAELAGRFGEAIQHWKWFFNMAESE